MPVTLYRVTCYTIDVSGAVAVTTVHVSSRVYIFIGHEILWLDRGENLVTLSTDTFPFACDEYNNDK